MTGHDTPPLVPVTTLRARMRDTSIPMEETIRLLRALASSLADAHRRGVVLGGFAPEDVGITAGGGTVLPTRAVNASAAYRASELTNAEVGGANAAGRADPRSDLYSWGLIAYELVTGVHPFASSEADIMHAHDAETPIAIDVRRSGLPDPLARAIMRCLEKRPEDRPGSADALLALFHEVAPLDADGRARGSRGGKLIVLLIVALAILTVVGRLIGG